jgi:hypothetical protein
MEGEEPLRNQDEPSEILESTSLQKRRRWVSGLAALCLLVAGTAWWWHEINVLPTIAPVPLLSLPNPNALNTFVRASDTLMTRNKGQQVDPTPSLTELADPALLAAWQSAIASNPDVPAAIKAGLAQPYAEPYRPSFGATDKHISKLFNLAMFLDATGATRLMNGNRAGAVDAWMDCIDLGSRLTAHTSAANCKDGFWIQGVGRQGMMGGTGIWPALERLNAQAARAGATRLERILRDHPPDLPSVFARERETLPVNLVGDLAGNRWESAKSALVPHLLLSESGNTPPSTPDVAVRNWWTFVCVLLHDNRSEIRAVQAYLHVAIPRAALPRQLRGPIPPMHHDVWVEGAGYLIESTLHEADRNACENGLLLLSLAERAYRSDHEKPPAALDALVPAYLHALPEDPYAPDGRFRYKLQTDKLLIYSVGPDGTDDGGKPRPRTEFGGEGHEWNSDIPAGSDA